MSELEKSVHSSYENLFTVDINGTIYDDPNRITSLLSPRIVDENTLSAIDVKDLFDAINHTKTRTGAATVFRSLVKPLNSLELILEKQNSLKELEKDRNKKEALNGYLNSLAQTEPYMHHYLFQCSYCQNEPYNLRFIGQYELYKK
jgi:DNA mismatch repair ATPase MutS